MPRPALPVSSLLARPTRSTLLVATAAFTLLAGTAFASTGAGRAAPRLVDSLPTSTPAVTRLAPPAAVPATVAEVPGLVRAAAVAGATCQRLRGTIPLCTHGDDPGLIHEPMEGTQAQSTGGSASSGTSQLGCYGNGTDGDRVQPIYARPDGSTDRYAQYETAFRGWASGIDQQFDTSALKTGQHRHVRFATTAGSGCVLSVLRVTLPASAFNSFEATVQALQDKGFNSASSKYLIWADATTYCGIATAYSDDSPGLSNINNGAFATYARVDTKCWGHAEAHELLHMLGAVQPSAPHSTAGYHCNDGADVMCYDDGTARSAQHNVCASSQASVFDCNNDDYFSTAAPAGSYLNTHWNTARSSFLEIGMTDPAPPPAAKPRPAPSAAPSPTPSPTDSPSPAPSQAPSAGVVGVLPSLLPRLPAPTAGSLLTVPLLGGQS